MRISDWSSDVCSSDLGPLEEFDFDTFGQVMRVNVLGSIIGGKILVAGMKARGVGRIVNISSRAALGKELRTAYAASKAALLGMTKTWALELGRFGITENGRASCRERVCQYG